MRNNYKLKMQSLFIQKPALYKILNYLPFKDILSCSLINKIFHENIWINEKYWKFRIYNKYGINELPKNMTSWKEYNKIYGTCAYICFVKNAKITEKLICE